MPEQATNESWDKALAFYDWLIAEGWSHLRGYRALVSTLGRSRAAAGLTAITSHEELVLSPYTRYPDWFEGRHVRLKPLPDGTVRIEKHPQQFSGVEAESWTLGLEDAKPRIEAVLAEL